MNNQQPYNPGQVGIPGGSPQGLNNPYEVPGQMGQTTPGDMGIPNPYGDAYEQPQGKKGKKSKPGKRKGYVKLGKFVWVTVFLVLSILGNCFLGFILMLGPGYTFSFETGLIGGADVVLDGTIDLQLPEEIAAREQNKDEPFNISYVVNKNPFFLTGDSAGTLALENPPESRYDLIFSIYLADGLHVYTSPKLKPVQYITSAKLNKKLGPGEYKAHGYFSYYEPDTGEYVGRQGVDIVISVHS